MFWVLNLHVLMFACLLSLVPVLKVKVGWPCHTEAETRKKNPRKEGETLNQKSRGSEGNQEKCYATRMPRHATLTKLRVHCKQNVGPWPAHAPKQHTTGQESAPMLLNNGKCYKGNSATNSQHVTKECQNTRDHSS